MKKNKEFFDLDTHFKVLHAIQENPTISQRDLANDLNVSLGKVNYCLKALVLKGLVKIENFKKNSNKRAYLYSLTPKGLLEKIELTSIFLNKKMKEFDRLKSEIEKIKSIERKI